MAVTGLTGHVHAFHVGSTVGVLIGGLTVAMATVLTHMHVLVRRGLGDDSLVLRRRHARQFFDERDHAPDSGVVVTGHHAPSRHRAHLRSEEHTSELQSLMRISYAVFCLKK